MIPGITAVRMTGAGRESLPLLVLGPAHGTSASSLWSAAAAGLTDAFDVVAWDLPGHGHSPAVEEEFTLAELAAGVLAVVDDIVAQRGDESPFLVAGEGAGGAVGARLLLDAPARVGSAVVLGGGGRCGPDGDLAAYDVDRELVESAGGRFVSLDGDGPAAVEAPDTVAGLLREHFLGETPADPDADDLTGALQNISADQAAGVLWERPGLDPRTRSLVTLAAVLADGRPQELAPHLRTARTHGVTEDEVIEVLLQASLHGADAGAAYGIVRQVFAGEG